MFLIVKILDFYNRLIHSDNLESYFELIKTTITTIIDNYNKSDKSKDLQHKVLISHPNGHRLVKNLITDYKDFDGEAKDFYGEIIEEIYELVIKELAILLQTRAIFVVIALIENTDYKDQVCFY